MKRILSLSIICILTLTSWMSIKAEAQNAIFEKYSDMDDVEYVCITSAMLRNLGSGSATINGVKIDGITEALKNVMIINSDSEEVVKTMKADFAKLRKDNSYEMMMDVRDDDQRVIILCSVGKKNSELIMFIQEGNYETSFVILNGKFTAEQLRKLLSSSQNN